MNREEIRNKIIQFFKQQLPLLDNPSRRPQIQISGLYHFIQGDLQELPQFQQINIFSIVREIIQEFINNGLLYVGQPGNQNSGYPWLTITEYGKQTLEKEDWLPYDPEGYTKELKKKIPDIDNVTLAYISESITAYNRRHLLSATLTLGVASENVMLLLIENYITWIKDSERKAKLEKKIRNKFIFTRYKEFRIEFIHDIRNLPKDLQSDHDTYLEGIFNFIRLNRNSAGHPTGKKLDAKVLYANLQIFSDYIVFIFNLIEFFKTK